MAFDEPCFLQAIDHRRSCAAAEAGVFCQLGRSARTLQSYYVETFHIGDVDAQELADRLVEEKRADAVFSGSANDLHHRVPLVHFSVLDLLL